MKNLFQTTFVVIIGLILLPNLVFGQLYEVSLDEKIQKSTLIVEGKVVESRCYRADDENIYTANKIKLTNLLKGDYREEYLTITTWGGGLDGELQTWTHLLTLIKGEQGIFFLEPTCVPAIKDADYPSSFDVYAATQGFIQFVQNEAKAWIGYEPFHTYNDIPNELYDYIRQQTGQKITKKENSGDAIRSGIRYHFADIAFQGNSITFDIYVNSLIGNKKLYQSGIQLGYNPAVFGSNLATNGNLSLQDAGISLSSTYDLAQSNVTSNKVKIELISVGSLSGLTEITTSEQLLAKGQITIQNFLADPGIIYDIAEMQAMSKFYEGGLQQVFDTVLVEGDWRPSSEVVTITSVSPLVVAGGIDQVITIKGTGFGTSPDGVLPPTTKRVLFTPAPEVFNPNPQLFWSTLIRSSTQYVSWTDTMIRVRVPSTGRDLDNPVYMGGVVNASASSEFIGIFDLTTVSPSIVQSPQPIYVKYSAVNQAYQVSGNEHVAKVKLANRNGVGGYDLKYNSQFDTLNAGNAKKAFERALVTWKCETGVNFRIKDTTYVNTCFVNYGTLPAGVTTATRAVTDLSALADCATSVADRFQYLTKWDMYFTNTITWHSDTTKPGINWTSTFDLETTALHELGHAHLLWHTNNPANVMYGLANQYKRALTQNDIDGGNYIMGYSTSTATPPCTPYMHMTAVSAEDCATVGLADFQPIEDYFVIAPNPTAGRFVIRRRGDHTNTDIGRVEIYNFMGQRMLAISPKAASIEIWVQDFTPGVYIVVIESERKYFTGKLIKH
ncbi:MAG TPA: zinc-dependent metalloprotease [Saprospiraceae bacterium]|nr:zinc-dependent metalloprotease [Saprospiraceae bacterium]